MFAHSECTIKICLGGGVGHIVEYAYAYIMIVQYVQKVVTRPDILNRSILSN